MLPTRYLVVLGALGGWAAFNGVVFSIDAAKRYRAEAAWFLFVAGLLVVAAIVSPRLRSVTHLPSARVWLPIEGAGAALAAAFLVFLPALSVGLLSDDFVLLDRAQRSLLAEPTWEYLRPLPLALWRLIAAAGDTDAIPWRLHAFNIAAHSLNVTLVAILATRLGFSRLEAGTAAALFLVFPGVAEPVVWASGVFDVTVVALMLGACIVSTTPPGNAQFVAIAILTMGALATKEIAVVLPMVLAITAWMSPYSKVSRRLPTIALSCAVVAAYLAIRIAGGFPSAPPAVFSGYAVKEILSRPFGFLGLPLHDQVLVAFPWATAMLATVWPALLLGSAARRWAADGDARLLVGLSLCVLVTVAPLAAMLFVAHDLQGSRYLYAGSAAWAMATVTLLRCLPPRLSLGFAAVVCLLFGAALRIHLSPWQAAGAERDRVLAAFHAADIGCSPTVVNGLPDHVDGAYVFRNGFLEAVALRSGATLGEQCAIEWADGAFRRVNTAQ